jgi:AbrB family looped-hinge helix DNA binding protein
MEQVLATVSADGQLAIPKAVRERLNLQEGTRVVLLVEGDELRIRRADNWMELRGLLADDDVDPVAALLGERQLDRDRER